MLRDIRIALRGMARAPAFTALAVLTLALGIGATTSVYSFVSGILLSDLPYREAGSLVVISRSNEVQGFRGLLISAPHVAAVHEWSESFDFVSGISAAQTHVGGDVEPERVPSASLLPGFLEQTGVAVILGRGFTEDEGETSPSILVSERLWRRRLGGDEGVIGHRLVVDGSPREIVGVLPGDSGLPLTEADVVFSLDATALPSPETPDESLEPGRRRYFRVIARLREGATIEAARAELDAIQQRLDEASPPPVPGWGLEAEPLQEAVVGDADGTLALLFGAVVVVLLIACVNVANLILARGLAREKELTLRVAMGAGRSRILGQLLTESSLVALTGGALGALLAAVGRELLVASSPPGVPRLDEVVLDAPVLLFALGVSVASGLLAGLLPALGLSKRAVSLSSRATDSQGWWRLRGGLTVFEAAMALALLVTAGLLTRSFVNLMAVDPGFSPEGAVSFGVSLPAFRFPSGEPQDAAVVDLLSAIEALPDAESAAASVWTPLSGAWGRGQVSVESVSGSVEEREQWPIVLSVTPGFFRTLRLPLLAGRDFSLTDRTDENGVVVVTEAMARAAWPEGEAVGRRVKFGGPGNDSPWLTVVGVTRDARLVGLKEVAEETMFLPFLGRGVATFQMFVRTRDEPESAMASIRETIRRVDPSIAVSGVRAMDAVAAANAATPRFYLYVVGLFAACSALLAAVGIFGVVAHGVVHRRREMGIRMALGAARGDVLGLVVRQGMTLVLLGVGLGLMLALASTRLLGTLLYDVGTLDTLSFVAASSILVIFGLGATLLPAWRASRIDPMVTLRAD